MAAINNQTASDRPSTRAAEVAREHDVLQLGCGEDQRDNWLNTDADPDCDPDYALDITEPWPDAWTGQFDKIVANHVLEHVPHTTAPGSDSQPTLMNHVFPEVSRVLSPGGLFEMRVPVGSNADTDPTHQSRWEWRTPEFYSTDGRHWVPDNGLTLVDRSLSVWMIGEFQALNRVVTPLASRYSNEFWYELPGATGEITARYRLTNPGGKGGGGR